MKKIFESFTFFKTTKLTFTFLVIILVSLITVSCELLQGTGKDDECEEWKRDLIEKKIVPRIEVTYKGAVTPLWGAEIDFLIHKEYCNGHTPANGYFSNKATSREDGTVFLGYTYTYKFENERDVLHYTINLTHNKASSSEPLKHTQTGKIWYNDVDISSNEVNHRITVEVPWGPE